MTSRSWLAGWSAASPAESIAVTWKPRRSLPRLASPPLLIAPSSRHHALSTSPLAASPVPLVAFKPLCDLDCAQPQTPARGIARTH